MSPQGVEQCLLMTDQFRKLSDKHANKEDKLQVGSLLTFKYHIDFMFKTYGIFLDQKHDLS